MIGCIIKDDYQCQKKPNLTKSQEILENSDLRHHFHKLRDAKNLQIKNTLMLW